MLVLNTVVIFFFAIFLLPIKEVRIDMNNQRMYTLDVFSLAFFTSILMKNRAS